MSIILDTIKRIAAALDRWRWTARSTIFAAFFSASAFYLALHGLLTDQYVAAITAIHAVLVARAWAEDRAAGKAAGTDDNGSSNAN